MTQPRINLANQEIQALVAKGLLSPESAAQIAKMRPVDDLPHPDERVRRTVAKDVAATSDTGAMDFDKLLGQPYEPTDEDMSGQRDSQGRPVMMGRIFAPSGPAGGGGRSREEIKADMASRTFAPSAPSERDPNAMASITWPASGPSPRFAPSAQPPPGDLAGQTWPASGPSPRYAPNTPSQQGDLAHLTWPSSGPSPKPADENEQQRILLALLRARGGR